MKSHNFEPVGKEESDSPCPCNTCQEENKHQLYKCVDCGIVKAVATDRTETLWAQSEGVIPSENCDEIIMAEILK